MKLCDKCGAINSDDRFFCVDCNEKLGDKLSDAKEKEISEDVAQKLENGYNHSDPLYVSLFDKIIGFSCILGIVLLIVAFILCTIKEKRVSYIGCGFIFFVYGIIEAFFPSLTWELERMRLSFTVADTSGAEPSGFYITFRKISEIIAIIIGFGVLILNLWQYK